MASGAFIAQGTRVLIDGVRIKGVRNLGGPTVSRPQVDVTDLDSTAREYLAGLKDNGEFRFSLNLIPTDPGQDILNDALNDSVQHAIRVEFPNLIEVLEFDGVVTGFDRSADVDSPVSADVTIRISGDYTRTVGTP